MFGAIIGDIVGSRFEWNNHKSKDFDFLTDECFVTDDSIITLAVAKALLDCNGDYSNLGQVATKTMQEVGRPYQNAGYGGRFYNWLYSDNPQPYNSYGNGAAMRISPVGFIADSMEQAIDLSQKVTEITHNHPGGIKGAEAITVAIFMARQGKNKEEIGQYINDNYYDLNFKLDDIRQTYSFNDTCQGTVPQAIKAFLESTDFEDAIRNAISIGGDSDTLACITGGIADAYYKVPSKFRIATNYLDNKQLRILHAFENHLKEKEEKSNQ